MYTASEAKYEADSARKLEKLFSIIEENIVFLAKRGNYSTSFEVSTWHKPHIAKILKHFSNQNYTVTLINDLTVRVSWS